MAKSSYIQSEIKALYPTKTFPYAYWDEIFLAFEGLTDEQFKKCLTKHRASPKYDWPPSGPEMVKTRLINYRTARPTQCKDCSGQVVRCGYCQQCIDRFDAARDRCITRVKKYGFKHVGGRSGDLPVNG
jgi:hypothetical protein